MWHPFAPVIVLAPVLASASPAFADWHVPEKGSVERTEIMDALRTKMASFDPTNRDLVFVVHELCISDQSGWIDVESIRATARVSSSRSRPCWCTSRRDGRYARLPAAKRNAPRVPMPTPCAARWPRVVRSAASTTRPVAFRCNRGIHPIIIMGFQRSPYRHRLTSAPFHSRQADLPVNHPSPCNPTPLPPTCSSR